MVKGLEVFLAHFRPYNDRFVLIGGTACDIAMTEAGLEFRATKDLDIVLWVEALDEPFVNAFWDFVRAGRYEVQHKSTGESQFYRFQKPAADGYPFMLELFARRPDVLQTAEESHLTPLPMEEEVSSLSAILIDAEYCEFIRGGRRETNGLPWIDAEHLIPLKVRAWLDLSQRKEAGEKVDSKAVKKHKNDAFRLYQIIAPLETPPPVQVRRDISAFIAGVKAEGVDLKALRVSGSLPDILNGLAKAYHCDAEVS
jgi:hypothetical protein